MVFFSMRFWTEEAFVFLGALAVATGLYLAGIEGFFQSLPLFLGSFIIGVRLIVNETRDKTIGFVCVVVLLLLGLSGVT